MKTSMHPMEAKVALGKIIVTDFHSAADAEARRRGLQRRGAPQGSARRHSPPCPMPEGVRVDGGIRVDKLLARIGLAESVSDAVRKIKAGAVQINGEKVKELLLTNPPAELLIQVGKNWKRVGTDKTGMNFRRPLPEFAASPVCPGRRPSRKVRI